MLEARKLRLNVWEQLVEPFADGVELMWAGRTGPARDREGAVSKCRKASRQGRKNGWIRDTIHAQFRLSHHKRIGSAYKGG